MEAAAREGAMAVSVAASREVVAAARELEVAVTVAKARAVVSARCHR